MKTVYSYITTSLHGGWPHKQLNTGDTRELRDGLNTSKIKSSPVAECHIHR